MRLRNGKYECAQCGTVLDAVPVDEAPRVTIHASSGTLKQRVLTLGDRVIHSCSIEDRPVGQPSPAVVDFGDRQREYAARARQLAVDQRVLAERHDGSEQVHLDAAVAQDDIADMLDRTADIADNRR